MFLVPIGVALMACGNVAEVPPLAPDASLPVAVPPEAPAPALSAAPRFVPFQEMMPAGADSEAVSAFHREAAAHAAAVRDLGVDAFLKAHPAPRGAVLDIDATKALGFTSITKVLKLTDDEKTVLSKQAFVASQRLKQRSYGYGYADIYSHDLPVLVTTDSGFYALHHSWDEGLAAVEGAVLAPALTRLLARIHEGLAPSPGDAAAADVDVYLAVARTLLAGAEVAPRDATNAATVRDLVAAAGAQQPVELVLYGELRRLELQQLKPRGHYTRSHELERYFQAMMWLSVADFQIAGTERVRALDAAATLVGGIDRADAWSDLARIDDFASNVSGPAEGVTATELSRLLADLHLTTPEQIHGAVVAGQLDAPLASGSYGLTRIRSSGAAYDLWSTNGDLAPRFSLMPQRYSLESHVLSNVVYDTPGADGKPLERRHPQTLDVLFALGNDAVTPLLESDLRASHYQANLDLARWYVDSTPESFWTDNVQAAWVDAMRGMNPSEVGAGVPATFRTDAWQRKVMHTQLAAWAEIRHDNVLYSAQSSGMSIGCTFPDHYVEPYPEVWKRLAIASRTMGRTLASVDETASVGKELARHFDASATTYEHLARIATIEVDGRHLDAKDEAFLGDLVELATDEYSGELHWSGWYADLIWPRTDVEKSDRIVATVHTAPNQDGGSETLHLGLGDVFLMVVAVQTPDGLSSYVGPVQGYHEEWRPGSPLNDKEWEALYLKQLPTVPDFLAPMWMTAGSPVGYRALGPHVAGGGASIPGTRSIDEVAPPSGAVSVGDGQFVRLDSEGTDLVEKLVRKNAGQLRYCYETRLKANAGLAGTIELRWQISGGRVTEVEVTKNNTGDTEFAECVAGKVKRWVGFPPDAEGEVQWPFVFKSSQ